jgi:hypothetical protein
MANIKSLQMWENICNDSRIGVSQSLFGLRTKAVYLPTGSELKAGTMGFSRSDGMKLQQILLSLHEGQRCSLDGFQPKPVPNGNYMVEVCYSDDDSFLAIQLFQFSRLSYEPVTDVLVFEEDDARFVGSLF